MNSIQDAADGVFDNRSSALRRARHDHDCGSAKLRLGLNLTKPFAALGAIRDLCSATRSE